MDIRAKERLTGAVILVALVVLVVPELLSGPGPRATRPQGAADEPPLRSVRLELGDELHGAAPPRADSEVAQPSRALSAAAEEGAATGSAAASSAIGSAAVSSAVGPPSASEERGPVSGSAQGAAVRSPGMRVAAAAPEARDQDAAPGASASAEGRGTPASASGARSAQSMPVGHAHRVASRSQHPERTARAQPLESRAQSLESRAWSVQVGSFESREHADRLVHRLKGAGFAAFISESAGHGRKWYRVRVGPERDRTAARAMVVRLHAAGHGGSIVAP